jgi:quinol-cytochrome oxidoreductase complex cytochrome b subunit
MKTGFFEEKEGVKSSTRLFSFILLIFYCVFTTYWSFSNNKIDSNYIIFSFIILVAVFAPKYLHKLAEIKGIKSD